MRIQQVVDPGFQRRIMAADNGSIEVSRCRVTMIMISQVAMMFCLVILALESMHDCSSYRVSYCKIVAHQIKSDANTPHPVPKEFEGGFSYSAEISVLTTPVPVTPLSTVSYDVQIPRSVIDQNKTTEADMENQKDRDEQSSQEEEKCGEEGCDEYSTLEFELAHLCTCTVFATKFHPKTRTPQTVEKFAVMDCTDPSEMKARCSNFCNATARTLFTDYDRIICVATRKNSEAHAAPTTSAPTRAPDILMMAICGVPENEEIFFKIFEKTMLIVLLYLGFVLFLLIGSLLCAKRKKIFVIRSIPPRDFT